MVTSGQSEASIGGPDQSEAGDHRVGANVLCLTRLFDPGPGHVTPHVSPVCQHVNCHKQQGFRWMGNFGKLNIYYKHNYLGSLNRQLEG